MTRARTRHVVELVLLAAIYIAIGRFGLQMDAVSGFATLVWPPTGIALAALLLAGRRLWPAIWIGALIVNAWTGAPLLVAVGIATGNTLEAVLGVWALSRVRGLVPSFERVRDVLAFIVFAALLATTVSATVGVLSLSLGGITPWESWGETWRAWWVGDVLGALVVTPLLTTWATGGRPSGSTMRVVEAAALAASLVLSGIFVFGPPVPWLSAFQQPYLLFPLLVWAAIRFGPRGAATATFIVAVLAIALTAASLGPFARERLAESLLHLQVFMAFDAVTFLAFAALGSEATLHRRELETALGSTRVAREQAERASELKTTFLSMVSHELRTPLTTLGLQLERLRIGARDLPPDAQHVVPRMLTQTQRLRELIEALLEHTRIASGHLALDVEAFVPAEIAQRCLEELRPRAEQKAIALSIHTTAAPPKLSSDPRLVRLILVNLVSNAIKFTQAGSVALTVARAGDACSFAVRDTGPGISADDQLRIFEPFEQLESGRRAHSPGVGLGLALVHELTSSLGGTIDVDSELGAGTTFTVVLPATPPTERVTHT